MVNSNQNSKSDKAKASKNKSESASQSRRNLEEIIGAFTQAAEAKGWSWQISAIDEKNCRYATIDVCRNEVDATFEITCDRNVILSGHKTSFYGHGIKDLKDAAWNEICKLPWLVSSADKDVSNPAWGIRIIEALLQKFHRIARPLKHRHADRTPFLISDEYDIQDLLHAVLHGFFEDIRAEEHTPSYAGGASRIDFLLKKEEIAIETKMASQRLRDKQVGEELIIDISRYKAHPSCKHLICFVYDPHNNLKNPTGLEVDLSKKHDSLTVKVIVVSPS